MRFATAIRPRQAVLALMFLASLCSVTHGQQSARPVDRSREIALGKALFFAKQLSADGTVACASCHDPAHAYADGLATPLGVSGTRGARNTPTLLNTSRYTRWSWDGRNTSLKTQVLEPLFSRSEHGLTHERDLLKIIRDTPVLASAYAAAFSPRAPYTLENVGEALAAYVLQLAAQPPAADGVQHVATPTAERGKVLFRGKAGCGTCHKPDSGFTDNHVHQGYAGAPFIDAEMQSAMHRTRLQTRSSKYQRSTGDAVNASLGAFTGTLDPADIGKFRTPSLLHVARTAPYMHDGSVASLRDAIKIEAKVRAPNVALDESEIDALLDYLNTLTN